jgi:hypothetical protein
MSVASTLDALKRLAKTAQSLQEICDPFNETAASSVIARRDLQPQLDMPVIANIVPSNIWDDPSLKDKRHMLVTIVARHLESVKASVLDRYDTTIRSIKSIVGIPTEDYRIETMVCQAYVALYERLCQKSANVFLEGVRSGILAAKPKSTSLGFGAVSEELVPPDTTNILFRPQQRFWMLHSPDLRICLSENAP